MECLGSQDHRRIRPAGEYLVQRGGLPDRLGQQATVLPLVACRAPCLARPPEPGRGRAAFGAAADPDPWHLLRGATTRSKTPVTERSREGFVARGVQSGVRHRNPMGDAEDAIGAVFDVLERPCLGRRDGPCPGHLHQGDARALRRTGPEGGGASSGPRAGSHSGARAWCLRRGNILKPEEGAASSPG